MSCKFCSFENHKRMRSPKVMKTIYSVIVVLVCLLMVSCDDDPGLDPNDSRLPAYSNKGYNIAAALINNVVWNAENRAPWNMGYVYASTLDVFKTDSLIFAISGIKKNEKNKRLIIDISFHLSNLNIKTYSDLKALENKLFILDGQKNYAELNDDDCYLYKNGVGNFLIKSVKEVTNVTSYGKDPKEFHIHPIIISGTFELKFKNPKETLSVDKGRFDFVANIAEIVNPGSEAE